MEHLVDGMVDGKDKMPSTIIDLIVERLMIATKSRMKKDLCRFLGIGEEAIRNAKKRGTIPPRWFITVSEQTGYQVEWLKYGTGRPFIGDVEPEIANPPPVQSAPVAPGVLSDDLHKRYRMQDVFLQVANVLESGTSYAQALLYNIQHFDRAVKDAQSIPTLEQEVSDLKQALLALQKELFALRKDYCRRLTEQEDLDAHSTPEICRFDDKAG